MIKLYEEGEYDNGCFTFTGNDLVHYLLNTPNCYAVLEEAYQKAFKYMQSSRFHQYISFRKCIKNKKLFKFTNLMCQSYLLNRIRWIYSTTKKAYIAEFGSLEMSDLEFEIEEDFRKFLIRYYSHWVYDHKVI